MVTIGIVSLIGIGVGTFAFQGMKLWNVTQDQVEAQENARVALEDTAGEIREMIIADNGSYPLDTAEEAVLIFYANIDSDDKREKIKYELVDEVFYRSVVEADDDQPPQYPAFTDDDRKVVSRNVVNTGYVFRYFDSSYNGETAPLTAPFELSEVSLVQIRLLVDYDPDRTPDPLEIETNISLRNLKYQYEN